LQRVGAPLSVAVLALNEASRLASCLESLRFADEVLLVDGGSQDRTVAIAEEFGCRVVVQPWLGYSRQKQLAVDRCRNDWVLILDADERIPPATAAAIRTLDLGTAAPAAYRLRRRNYFHGRWIRRCGWWPDRVVRLVDRRRGRFCDRQVHEQWLARGPVAELDADLEHRSFRTYADLVQKMQLYSSLSALEMAHQDLRVHPWSAATHGLWSFLNTYLFQLGLLEGFDGFMIAMANAGGSFLKYAKLYELNRYGDGREGED